MVTQAQLENAILMHNLTDKVVILHSAYGSFGGVEGGPNTIIDCFLRSGCTLVVPTFTYDNDAYPPKQGDEYLQNGMQLSSYTRALQGLTDSFQINSQQISRAMGVLPKVVLAHSKRVRGVHPVNSFTALGPKAKEIMAQQTLLNVYGPYELCYQQEDAVLLLMGIDFTGVTPIHFAEQLAGRTLFRAWANMQNTDNQREVVEVSIGACSSGFNRLQDSVQHLAETTMVGNSLWRSYGFNSFIDTLTEQIKQSPEITHCPDIQCIRCHDAILGGPIIN
ncbi:AAC(3) family N-acetyltransferase [Psychromonas sp. psych-6C06]|uniref:AAC(3) family N-acetyltransferase n=1 Tax=Psychromonas sp. psych-6C06 TaxID=2058089 RepID=UPI000C32BD99|nr:AAC(3) family N-acetyltransferase [Psychromonas sp. psych-6C06]PKF62721.1 AAC(3) family N-acetyltransferase [Psychromonas sp. psych-6C06]